MTLAWGMNRALFALPCCQQAHLNAGLLPKVCLQSCLPCLATGHIDFRRVLFVDPVLVPGACIIPTWLNETLQSDKEDWQMGRDLNSSEQGRKYIQVRGGKRQSVNEIERERCIHSGPSTSLIIGRRNSFFSVLRAYVLPYILILMSSDCCNVSTSALPRARASLGANWWSPVNWSGPALAHPDGVASPSSHLNLSSVYEN